MTPELIGFFDIVIGIGWLILLMSFFWVLRIRKLDHPHYQLFYPAILFKLGFGVLFALTYTLVLEGGDTLAYWDGAVKLNKLFWENPGAYFAELWQTPSSSTIRNHFNEKTGFPPGWIYREPESFFVCKVTSLFTFFTFNSYLALSLISAALAGITSWKMYELVKDFNFCKKWVFAFATLFVPTVAFWCSGISKDTYVLIAFQTLVYVTFSLLLKKKKWNAKYVLLLLLSVYFLYVMRDFMLIAVLIPLSFVITMRFIRNIKHNPPLLWTIRILFVGVTLVFSLIYIQNITQEINNNAYLEEMAVLQQDFAKNKLYTGPRYDLGITDYSTFGVIKAAPLSVITAFYRPFPWEASSPFLLLSALEGLLLLFLTLGFFFRSGNLVHHFRFVSKNEILIFAIIFSLILGFFAGFTSGLFNVLVRFKAPFMALIIIFFAARPPHKIINKE